MTTKAITPYDRIKNLLRQEEVRDRFAEILGEKAQAFLASVISTVYTNDDLSNCEPTSVMFAALKAATLDLPVEPNLGQGWIIPYKGKAVFQIGYKGIVQLALRTREYLTINATEIYEGERIKINRLTGAIVLNGAAVSDKVIGYCGYFKMKSGYEHYLYMTVDELLAYAQKYSPSWKVNNSLWHTNFPEMAKKTVIKRMLTKYGELRIDRKFEEVLSEEDQVEGEVTDLGEEPPEENKTAEVPAETTTQKQEPVTEPKKRASKKRKTKKAEEPGVTVADTLGVNVSDKVQTQESVTTTTPPTTTTNTPTSTSKPTNSVPQPPEEPPTVPDFPIPIPSQLVQKGYFNSETQAKMVLGFFRGPYVMNTVEPWVKIVVERMRSGDTVGSAVAEANKQFNIK